MKNVGKPAEIARDEIIKVAKGRIPDTDLGQLLAGVDGLLRAWEKRGNSILEEAIASLSPLRHRPSDRDSMPPSRDMWAGVIGEHLGMIRGDFPSPWRVLVVVVLEVMRGRFDIVTILAILASLTPPIKLFWRDSLATFAAVEIVRYQSERSPRPKMEVSGGMEVLYIHRSDLETLLKVHELEFTSAQLDETLSKLEREWHVIEAIPLAGGIIYRASARYCQYD